MTTQERDDHFADAMRYAFTAMAPKLTWSQRFSRWLTKSWSDFKLLIHGWIYRAAFAVGLGWKLNRFRHWLGLYPTYGLSGRCQWCGEVHKSKPKEGV